MKKYRSYVLFFLFVGLALYLILYLLEAQTGYRVEYLKVAGKTKVEKKVVLGSVKKMKVTCYTLVEFGSDGVTADGTELTGPDGWYNNQIYGIAAHNGLPFGTRLKVEGFGDMVWYVKDRIGYGTELDLYWGSDVEAYQDCKKWGTKNLEVLILYDEPSVFAQSGQ